MAGKAALAPDPKPGERKFGLAHWMNEVLLEAEKARADFAEDPVHDLRVAIRRCRSVGEGFQAVDPDPSWKKMRKAGKLVFAALGTLRDVQVLIGWVEKLGTPDDPATQRLLGYCREQERIHKLHAAEALTAFNAQQWQQWANSLPRRAAHLKPGSEVFLAMALERWAEARELHRVALRGRSKVALHRLRIGVKKLRYLVENFLPALHAAWGKDLKFIQDDLGEVHDLDVLWDTAIRIRAFQTTEERAAWQKKITDTRQERVDRYRAKMVGRNSLWDVWRSQLPQGPAVDHANLAWLRTWAGYRDREFAHAQRVSALSLQLHDGLSRTAVLPDQDARTRVLLQSAALLHGVGRSKGKIAHHKSAQKMILQIAVPFGWTAEDRDIVAVAARFHRGAVPAMQKRFIALRPEAQQKIRQVAGILRLADAMDRQQNGKIRHLRVSRSGDCVVVHAREYDPLAPNAERLAAARYLLEQVSGAAILVRGEEAAPADASK